MNEQLKKRSLGKSIDGLRHEIRLISDGVKELYELDQDNFSRIQGIRTVLTDIEKRIGHLEAKHRQGRRRSFFGAILAGTGVYCAGKVLMSKLEKLNDRVRAVEENETERDG